MKDIEDNEHVLREYKKGYIILKNPKKTTEADNYKITIQNPEKYDDYDILSSIFLFILSLKLGKFLFISSSISFFKLWKLILLIQFSKLSKYCGLLLKVLNTCSFEF